MIQHIKFFLISLLAVFTAACGGNGSSNVAPDSYRVTGDFSACQADSMRLYYLDGFMLQQLDAAAITSNGDKTTFTLDGKLPQPGFYWLGTTPQNVTSVLLGGENQVVLGGNCSVLNRSGKVTGSPANDAMKSIGQQFAALQTQYNSTVQQMNSSAGPRRAEFLQKATDIFNRQKSLVDSLKTTLPTLAKVYTLSLFPPFDIDNNPKNYNSPMEHFAGEYLSFADLSDPAYNYIPLLGDYCRGYCQNLFAQLPKEKATQAWNTFLDRMPKGSLARKNVMAKSLMTLESMKSPVYSTYGEMYLTEHPGDPNAQVIRQIGTRIEQEAVAQAKIDNLFAVGATPPEITLPDPDGRMVSLSSLKGKVVMIDFWASWCRPCRMENPNVVKLYDRYKNQGFEILGVSLDKEKSKWVQAIDQDGLTWKHVSDLKFWQSQAAQDYAVRSIPATFLLDREGKVLAKGLRGPALEAKLAEVFAAR